MNHFDRIDLFWHWYNGGQLASAVDQLACYLVIGVALAAGLAVHLVIGNTATAIVAGLAVNYALAYRVWRWSVRRPRTGGFP